MLRVFLLPTVRRALLQHVPPFAKVLATADIPTSDMKEMMVNCIF